MTEKKLDPLVENESTQLITYVETDDENADPNTKETNYGYTNPLSNKAITKYSRDIGVRIENFSNYLSKTEFVQGANQMISNLNFKIQDLLGINTSDSDDAHIYP